MVILKIRFNSLNANGKKVCTIRKNTHRIICLNPSIRVNKRLHDKFVDGNKKKILEKLYLIFVLKIKLKICVLYVLL